MKEDLPGRTREPVKWSDQPDDDGYYCATHDAGQLSIRWVRGCWHGYVAGKRVPYSWALRSAAQKAVEDGANQK